MAYHEETPAFFLSFLTQSKAPQIIIITMVIIRKYSNPEEQKR
jgi:hypothetical protein